MKIIINYIIPLGSQCFSSFFLKKYALKKISYPFDWIFSSPEVIINILDDKFKKFLNKDYLAIKNEKSKINKHLIYLPNLTMFNHRNPYNDEDYLYYMRCIDRFYKVLNKNEKKLFILTSLKNEINNELENICLLNHKLSCLTNNYILIAIFQKCTGEQSKDIYEYENMIIIQITTISESDGVIFLNDLDDIYYKSIIDSFFEFNLNNVDDLDDLKNL
jgi:hypothetical protein